MRMIRQRYLLFLLPVILFIAAGDLASEPMSLSEFSPYYQFHEMGFVVKPVRSGCIPKELRKTLPGYDSDALGETGGDGPHHVAAILAGHSTSAEGIEKGDTVYKISDNKKLNKMSYREILAELTRARKNELPITMQRIVHNANNEAMVVTSEYNLCEESSHKRILEETKRNYVQDELIDSRHALILGDFETARSRLMEAVLHMEELEVAGEKQKRTSAMIGAEDAKYFKGDIYETAMANYYMGLLSYIEGNDEEALIGFRRALLNDQESKKPEHQDDFGGSHFMCGLVYGHLNEGDNSRIAFEKLRKCGYSTCPSEEHNTLFIVEMGHAPRKTSSGLEGQLDRFIRDVYPEATAEIFVDGRSIGRTGKIMDIYQQASTMGRTGKDNLQTGKAVTKFMFRLAASAVSSDLGNAVGRAWDVRADTRTWSNLPAEIQALPCRIDPGVHDVTLRFHDAAGRELKRYEQTWYCLPVREDQCSTFLFQAEYDRCNIAEPLELTRIVKVKDKEQTVLFNAYDITGLEPGDTLDVVCLREMVRDEAGELLDVNLEKVNQVKVTRIKKKKAYADIVDWAVGIDKTMYVTRSESSAP